MKKRHRYILAIALLLTTYTNVQAQQIQAKLSHYSTEDGLASNAIAKMRQDDWGFIWIATWNGLSRFDGYNFYNYRTGTLSHIPNLHNRVEQIAVDNQQNVWMRMYDKRIFVLKRSIDRIINPFDGITGNEDFRTNRSIFVTSGGDVLVPIVDKGIYKMKMEPNRVDCRLITTGGLTVTSMAEGYQNDVWLGTNEGIHRMDASNMTVEKKGMFLDEYIECLYSNGYNVYAGTRSGKIVSFAYGQDPVVIRQGGDEIQNIFVDSHGLIWFTDSGHGVLKLDLNTGQERRYTQTLKTINYDGYGGEFHDVNGTVWIHMNHGGYGYYDRERDEVEYFHNDPSNPWNLSNVCNASLETNDGVIFESTSSRGLEKLEIMKNIIERKMLVPGSTIPYDNDIRAIYYDSKQKTLFMANKSGMLFVTFENGQQMTITHSDDGTPFGRIYGIMKDSKDNVWLSSKDIGLFKMAPRTGGGWNIVNYRHNANEPATLNDDHAYQTVEDNDGNLWVATYGGGVNLLPKGSVTFINCSNEMKDYPLNSYMKVRTLAIDKDGNVWAGTTDGVLILTYKNGKVETKQLAHSEEQPDNILLSNDIVCIGRDNSGMMWVGTNGGGLGHTTGKDSQGRWLFESFGSRDGLPSEEIFSLTFDTKGNVWFATEHTLCSFNKDKRIFTTFSALEGVDETMCSEDAALSLPNGNILFGTTNGYYEIDRVKLISNNAAMFKLKFTDFWVDDVLQSPSLTNLYDYYVPDAKSVELPSHLSSFALRFVSLNYQLQHRVHYQYMLEGYDSDWINAGRDRKATYSNVPSGTYKFVVKAFLLESPDKYDMKEMEIVIPPPFLFSSNAVWIYMLIVAVIGLALLFWRQRLIRDKMKRQMVKTVVHGDNENRNMKQNLFQMQLEAWLENNYTDHKLTFDAFMENQQISRADFEDELRSATRKTPREFLTDFRIEKAKQMLEHTNDSVADVSFNTGFADPMQFNRLFTNKTGMTPSQYRDHSHQAGNGDTDEYEVISDQ